jgi:hypothetical protein
MRIIKYLFFLLILSFVTLTIFVATQKGEFTVEKIKIINSPRSAVFNYVNDSKNWENWNSLALEDSAIIVTYSQNTIGKGSSYSWNGKEGSGEVKTINTKENESIIQKMNFNDNSSDVFINFKDTIGGTKISWRAKGKMSFAYKLMTIYHGGATNFIGLIFEKSLANLDKILDYEINNYSIKVNGITTIPTNYYLAQTFTSKISNVIKNSEIVNRKITTFCKKNNIVINGKPFVIYNTYDEKNEITKLSICVPIKNQIFLVEGSDIISGKFDSVQAVKSTLTGDYSHLNKALAKTLKYVSENHLMVDPVFSHTQVNNLAKPEIKNPSKWITEIYIPIKPKAIKIITATKPLDTNTTKKEIIVLKTPKIISTKKGTITTNPKITSTPKKEKVVKTPKTEIEIPSEF